MATRTNAKPGSCSDCGGTVPAGAGSLWWEAGPDDGGNVVGRAPAGWRVTHLRSEDCAAHRSAAVAERQAELAPQIEAARIAREAYEADLAALAAKIDRAIAEHGLVPVPERCRLLGRSNADPILFERAVCPPDRGVSAEMVGRVFQQGSGYVAQFGPSVGGPRTWASPELVEAGISRYRVHQWWIPGAYAAKDYPGPAPEAELTEAEQAQVARLRAEAAAAHRAEALRGLAAVVPHAAPLRALLAVPGVTWELDTGPDLDAYVTAMAAPLYSKERDGARLEATLRVTVPTAHFTRGRLRAATQKLLPPGQVELNRQVFVRVEVATAEAMPVVSPSR